MRRRIPSLLPAQTAAPNLRAGQHAAPLDRVWGAAFRIPPSRVAETRESLDLREANGYSAQEAPFFPADGTLPPLTCLVYIALPHNPQFVGPQQPQALAEHIAQSQGPSGRNSEYLFRLEQALDGLAPGSEDGHVSDLAERVRRIERAAACG